MKALASSPLPGLLIGLQRSPGSGRLVAALLALFLFPCLPALAGDGEAISLRIPPNPVEKLYDRAAPAVVGVESRQETDFYLGTGVIVDPRGLVMTSTTAVPPRAHTIRVYVRGGKRLPAQVVQSVPEKEFCLLRIEREGTYPSLELGNSEAIRLGEPSVTLGNAFLSIVRDDHVCVNSGIVSGIYPLTRERSPSRYTGTIIETTTLVNDYMDGSPVLDRNGRIIGMLSLNYSTRRWLGAAVPIDVLKPLFGEHRPWYSDRVHPASFYLGLDLTLKAPAGDSSGKGKADPSVVIDGVAPGSPAARAGLAVGQRLLEVDGKPIGSFEAYQKALEAVERGQKFTVRVRDPEADSPRNLELAPWREF